jgi:hypothetical protein
VYVSIYVKNPDLFLLTAKALRVAAEPTVPWKSLALDRTVAGFRGENSYLPDDSWKAIGPNQAALRQMAREHEPNDSEGNPSADAAPD